MAGEWSLDWLLGWNRPKTRVLTSLSETPMKRQLETTESSV